MPPAARARLLRRLGMVNAAHDFEDLRSLGSGPTEPTGTKHLGRIGVGGDLQISFRWENSDASDVAIVLAADGVAA